MYTVSKTIQTIQYLLIIQINIIEQATQHDVNLIMVLYNCT